MHSFDRFIQLYNTGNYFKPGYIESCVHSYEHLRKEKYNKGNYWDSSYYEGYQQGLIYIALCDTNENLSDDFPMFYLPNAKTELNTYENFGNELERVENVNGKYKRYATKILEKYSDPTIVIHHPPY